MILSIKFSFMDGVDVIIDRSADQIKYLSEQLSVTGLLEQLVLPGPIHNSEDEEEVYENLSQYLMSLIENPDIVKSSAFREFLNPDGEQEKGRTGRERSPSLPRVKLPTSGMASPVVQSNLSGQKIRLEEAFPPDPRHRVTTAIDFLLQPLDMEVEYIKRREKAEREVFMEKGQYLVWHFVIQSGLDIDFSVTFQPNTFLQESISDSQLRAQLEENTAVVTDVHRTTRYSTPKNSSPVQGSYQAPCEGSCVLCWDNTFAAFRGRTVTLVCAAVSPEAMEAALEAADQNVEKGQRSELHQHLVERTGSGNARIKIEVGPVRVGSRSCSQEEGNFVDEDEDGEEKKSENEENEGKKDLDEPSRSSLPQLAMDKAAWVEQKARHLAGYIWLWQNKDGSQEICEKCCEHGIPMMLNSENAAALETAMVRIEELEDELATTIALHEKAEAEARYAEAKMDRTNLEKNRANKALEELIEEKKVSSQKMTLAFNKLAETLGDLDAQREKNNLLEEDLNQITKQKELLEMEKHTWQVAEGDASEEVKRACAETAKTQHQLEDTQRSLEKERQSIKQLEEQVAKLQEDLKRTIEENESNVTKQMVEAAKNEAEDMCSAVGELEAEVTKLKAEKNVMMAEIQNLKNRSKDALVASQVEGAESRIVQRSLEAKVSKLKAEKKVLISEVKAARKALGRQGVDSELRKLSFMSSTSFNSEKESVVNKQVHTESSIKVDKTLTTPTQEAEFSMVSNIESGGEDAIELAQINPTISNDPSTLQRNEATTEEEEHLSKERTPSPVFVKGTEVSVDFDSEKLGELCVADPTFCNVHRQLLECRERRHTLSNLLEEEPENVNLQRLFADVTSAVKSLEVRMQVLIKNKQETISS